jgi:serine/threonine protein kinase
MLGVQGGWRAGEAAVAKYRIVSHLGQGGTADVYLAVADGPAGFRKLVVLKVLRKNLSCDPEFRAMFLSEAKLAARLNHPNVVQTNEVLDLDGTPVIVMEYLEGQPLSQVIVRGRDAGFSLAMQLRVLIDALQGLHAAHELADFDGTPLGVVHRDVSPQNIFVTLDGQAKVLDFGIAKIERSTVDTEVGTIKGKLRYMAAEQIAGDKLGRRADIYSAGVILWEALAGERMWKGCSEAEIRERALCGDIPRLPAAPADAPPALVQICRRALSLSPADRHATALELADELEAAVPDLGARASHRQIGALVAKVFESERAATKGLLERESQRNLTAADPLAQTPRVVSVPEDASVANRIERRSLRRGVLWAVTGTAVVALGFAYFIVRRNGAGPGSSRAPMPEVSSSKPKATPVTAAPSVPRHEDQPVMPQAAVAAVPDAVPDDGSRRAHPRNTVSARWSSKRPRPSALPSEADATGSPATDDCKHPFFFDGNGIKKFRPECM